MIMRGLGLTVPAANLDNLPLVTDPRYALNSFKGCVNELAEYEVPEYCDECTDLDAKVQEYVKLNLEAVELIKKGHRIPSLKILSDGLEARWDADELWDEIRLDVVAIREVYDLEPLW
jgi:hypothetical protein